MAMSGLEFLILPPLIPKGTYCPVWLPTQSRKVFKVIFPLNLISRVVGLCLDTQLTFPVSYRQAPSYEAFPAIPFPLLFCFSKENRTQKHRWELLLVAKLLSQDLRNTCPHSGAFNSAGLEFSGPVFHSSDHEEPGVI